MRHPIDYMPVPSSVPVPIGCFRSSAAGQQLGDPPSHIFLGLPCEDVAEGAVAPSFACAILHRDLWGVGSVRSCVALLSIFAKLKCILFDAMRYIFLAVPPPTPGMG